LRFAAGFAVAVVGFAAAAPALAQSATQVTSANSTGYTSPSAASNLLNAAGTTLTPSVTPPFVASGDAATSTTYATLTDGSFGSLRTSSTDTTTVEMQSGSSLLYTFAAPETISTIDTYSGWANANRVNQTYSILYTTTANDTLTMLQGSSVNFAPGTNSSFVQLAIAGGLTNVTSIEFLFGTQQNGYVGYKELSVLGIPSSTANAVTWAGTGATWDTNATNWTNSNSLATGQTYADGDVVTFDDSGSANPNVTIQAAGVNPASVAFANTTTSYAFTNASGTVGIGGAGTTVTLNGTGTVRFNSPNTYSGATTVNAGTLTVANQLALQNSTLTPTGGNVVFDQSVGSNAFTVGGLAGTGNLSLQNNAATPAAVALTVSGNGVNTTYSGILSGLGSLTLNNPGGTLTLSGTSTYAGSTTISQGTLRLGNTVAVADYSFANANDPGMAANNQNYRAIDYAGKGTNVLWTPLGSSWTFQNHSGIATGNGGWGLPAAPAGSQAAANGNFQVGVLQDYQSLTGAFETLNFPTAGTYTIGFQAAYSTAGNGGNEPLNLFFGGNTTGGVLNPGVFE
jgi:autotransporter-associated beta strand protein